MEEVTAAEVARRPRQYPAREKTGVMEAVPVSEGREAAVGGMDAPGLTATPCVVVPPPPLPLCPSAAHPPAPAQSLSAAGATCIAEAAPRRLRPASHSLPLSRPPSPRTAALAATLLPGPLATRRLPRRPPCALCLRGCPIAASSSPPFHPLLA